MNSLSTQSIFFLPKQSAELAPQEALTALNSLPIDRVESIVEELLSLLPQETQMRIGTKNVTLIVQTPYFLHQIISFFCQKRN